ncbi:class I SAM-dependent methyltransferase [Longimicrobium sp.]|uniref:class I SAM-dependent methyltransferase n=1 Tax=Longimicrobium sp. TaxID=2029185 RepID=UPI002BB61A86|nr:class I SAM-dependent methyltransferase [Longimicrobium sp.]HSU15851.1 class I SAM-dependent methyltransferase [Longimicrobium sp.]
MGRRKNQARPAGSDSWNPVADWYTGWVGAEGSEHHRRVAIPALLELLLPARGEQVLDVGCGPGVLAPHVAGAGARYTGVDASRRLLEFARRHHAAHGRFVQGDATKLQEIGELQAGAFDAAVFLLSIQDIDPLEDALAAAAWAVRPGGRVVLLMTHPCFRIPRQSGWGWDRQRKLQYRRVDRYLTRLAVPMKSYGAARHGFTRSYHRPLGAYVNGLAACGLRVDGIHEIPTHKSPEPGPHARAERLATREIPLFLGLRAVKEEGR